MNAVSTREEREERRAYWAAKKQALQARLGALLKAMDVEGRKQYFRVSTQWRTDPKNIEPGDLAYLEDINSQWHLPDDWKPGDE